MKKLSILFLFLFITPINLMAETLFVGDTLRVGIRPEPHNNTPSIRILKSGAEVKKLRRKNSYTKIRTQSGVVGWVKSAYLTPKAPASRKLKVATEKIETLQQKLTTLQRSLGDGPASNQEELHSIINRLKKEKNTIFEELSGLKSELKTRPKTSLPVPPAIPLPRNDADQKLMTFNAWDTTENFLYILIGSIIAVLVLGFLMGVSWYKQQVTKRLGGLTI